MKNSFAKFTALRTILIIGLLLIVWFIIGFGISCQSQEPVPPAPSQGLPEESTPGTTPTAPSQTPTLPAPSQGIPEEPTPGTTPTAPSQTPTLPEPSQGIPEPPPSVVESPPPTIEVAIEGFAFRPAEINVLVGSTVTWYNRDSVTHTVTAQDNSFDSGRLSGGGTFSYTFREKGTFEYNCVPHPYMKGKVIVE